MRKAASKKRNAGVGSRVTFHGKFKSKILAARREKEIPGSFILTRGGYYFVLKEKGFPRRTVKRSNPKLKSLKGWTLIYDKVTRVEATKGKGSLYPDQPFFHKFTRPYPKMYGSPDRTMLLIVKKG